MEQIWLVVASLLSGIVAGMGMGGGTFLIPVLTIFFAVNQHSAQAINLLVFIPCAIISLIIHFKNKLVDIKVALVLIAFGLLASVPASLLALNTQNDTLKKMFGGFLLAIGVFQLLSAIINLCKPKRGEQNPQYKVVVFPTKRLK